MYSEIHEFLKSCERCQRNNDVFHKPHSTLHPIPVPGVVWQQIGIDVVTMPTSKMGNKYIITCVDYFSKWPEAAASKDKSAVSVANFIFETICRFGCAKVVITDQGREFVNSINEELMSLTGTNHRITSAYHPQSNGLVERFNQTLQNSLRKCSLKSSDDWDSLLPSVLFAIRTSVQKSTKYTPFQLMFNRQPVLPIELELKGQLSNADETNFSIDIDDVVSRMTELRQRIFQSASQNIDDAQVKYKEYYNKKRDNPEKIAINSKVLVKNSVRDSKKGMKMAEKWQGPYTIHEDLGNGCTEADTSRTAAKTQSPKSSNITVIFNAQ
uniref:Integrase catalytic domain-containing protein n=1 Tax=Amphimedon queenslandica TaxID=400682 RepID=A0A1X7T9K1_AMPQE